MTKKFIGLFNWLAGNNKPNSIGYTAVDATRLAALNHAQDCAEGLHSWVHEPEKLSPDTPCAYCGELYGHPD